MLVPRYVETWICIVDLADLSAFKIDINVIKSIADVSRVNFMGCLHRLYICGASISCRLALGAVRPLMAKRTSDKIKIISEGEEK